MTPSQQRSVPRNWRHSFLRAPWHFDGHIKGNSCRPCQPPAKPFNITDFAVLNLPEKSVHFVQQFFPLDRFHKPRQMSIDYFVNNLHPIKIAYQFHAEFFKRFEKFNVQKQISMFTCVTKNRLLKANIKFWSKFCQIMPFAVLQKFWKSKNHDFNSPMWRTRAQIVRSRTWFLITFSHFKCHSLQIPGWLLIAQ